MANLTKRIFIVLFFIVIFLLWFLHDAKGDILLGGSGDDIRIGGSGNNIQLALYDPLTLSPTLALDTTAFPSTSTDFPLMTVRRVNEGDEIEIYGYNPEDPRQYKTTSEPILPLGSELVTNGGFTTATGWVVTSAWDIDTTVAGKAYYNDTVVNRIEQSITITKGKRYKVDFTISNASSGATIAFNNEVTAYLFDFNTTYVSYSDGVYSFNTIALQDATSVRIYGNTSGGTFEFDNFSIKEIPGGYYIEDETLLYPNEEFHVVAWYDQSQGLGSELVTNGTFNADITGVTITSGDETSSISYNTTDPISGTGDLQLQVTVVGTSTSTPYIDLAHTSLTIGKAYKFSFRTKVVSGTAILRAYAVGGNRILDETLNDEQYHEYIIPNALNDVVRLYFTGTNLFNLQIDDVSVKEIQGNHATQTTAANQPELVWEGATFGSELVKNGTFDTDTNWAKGTGWSISGGTANCDGTQVASSNISQPNIEIGKIYELIYTVSSYTAGQVRIQAGANGLGVQRSATGTYTETIKAVTNPYTIIQADLNFIGSVDNVSVKEVLTWNTPTLKFDGSDDFMSNSIVHSGAATVTIKLDPEPPVGFQSLITVKSTTVVADAIGSEIMLLEDISYQPYSWRFDLNGSGLSVGITDSVLEVPHFFAVTYNGGVDTSPLSYTATLNADTKSVVASGLFDRLSGLESAIGARVTYGAATTYYNGKYRSILHFPEVLPVSSIKAINNYYD